jgi:very-short-patch-repair endonuclease
MSKRYTINEVKELSIKIGIEFIDKEYINNHTPHLFICPSCKKEVKKEFKDVLKGHILCLDCSSKLGKNKFSLEKVKELARSVGCEFLDSEYTDSKYKHTFLCSKCKKNTFKRTLNDIINKTHPKTTCNKCAIKSRQDSEKIPEIKFNEYKKYYEKQYYIKILSEYKDYKNYNTKNLKCFCKICNNTKYMSLQQLSDLTSQTGCGCSHISYGERTVLEFLEHNGIKYNFQKLLPIGLYSDFEIELENDKTLLLEIDGSQHYIYQKYFHRTYDEFLHNKENDKIKDKWYIDNGNNVLRIKYEKTHGIKNWKNDDIDRILKNILEDKYGIVKRKEINTNYNIIEIVRKHTMSKGLLVYKLDGKFYKKYDTQRNCEKDLGINNLNKERTNVIKCGNYMIRDYMENYPLQIEPYKGKLRKIKVYENGNIIGTYNSLREMSKILKIDRNRVSEYLKGKSVVFKENYHFEYTY